MGREGGPATLGPISPSIPLLSLQFKKPTAGSIDSLLTSHLNELASISAYRCVREEGKSVWLGGGLSLSLLSLHPSGRRLFTRIGSGGRPGCVSSWLRMGWSQGPQMQGRSRRAGGKGWMQMSLRLMLAEEVRGEVFPRRMPGER
jgi:hypothetical protein